MQTTTAILSLNGQPQAMLLPGTSAVERHPEASVDTVSVGDATQRVMALLGSVVRIKITDGRVLLGTFHCVDKQQNVILTDTREFLPLQRNDNNNNSNSSSSSKKKKGSKASVAAVAPTPEEAPSVPEEEQEHEARELWKTGAGRSLGMTLVPGKHIVYIKVRTPYKQS